MSDNIVDSLIEELKKDDNVSTLNEDVIIQKLEDLKKNKLNVIFVGATGVGKSSTINAIFDTEIARVGYSVDPETSTIQKYEIDNVILWDTPGLGDSPEKDKIYSVEIANALKMKDNEGNAVIDEVVVVVDASNRDMRTTYEIIEKVVAPYIEDSRIIIAINQCDMALKGRYWNYDKSCPDEKLEYFLGEKVQSIRNRVKESTGIDTNPIFYSALHKYNISKLLLTMLRNMKEEKRFLFTDSLNKNPDIWSKNDKIEEYNDEIKKEVKLSITNAIDSAAKGAIAGATIGKMIPIIGPVIGATVGAALGFLGGLVE